MTTIGCSHAVHFFPSTAPRKHRTATSRTNRSESAFQRRLWLRAMMENLLIRSRQCDNDNIMGFYMFAAFMQRILCEYAISTKNHGLLWFSTYMAGNTTVEVVGVIFFCSGCFVCHIHNTAIYNRQQVSKNLVATQTIFTEYV